MFCYDAFQLKIQSELALPELLMQEDAVADTPDVVIEFGNVSQNGLSQAVFSGAFYESNQNALWLNIPDVARYLIRDGRHITIDPSDASDEDSIRIFLLGSCIGALLIQRDLFLLHANAVKVGDACVSFSGRSGAGKSTLSAAFMHQGYSILADDVCAINALGDVIPSFPQIRLWADASKKLAIQTHTFRKIRPNFEKFSVPLETQFYASALPLKVIYILNTHNLDTFKFEAVTGMQKLLPLKNNTYRYQYLKGLGKTKGHLKQTGALASKADVVRITRPKSGFRLDELVDLIHADLATRGISGV